MAEPDSTGWAGNQSLEGIITRLAGSVNGAKSAWIVAAVLVVAAGIIAAALLDRKGHAMPGLLMAALTGLLVSPISWDHHWVWIAPGAVVAAHYAVQAWRRGAWRAALACGLLAVGLVAWFGAWPTSLFGVQSPQPREGLARPDLDSEEHQPDLVPVVRRPALVSEYHWHGLALIAGNAYVLAGLAVFGVLLALSLLLPHAGEPHGTKEHDNEPGRGQGSLRGRLRLPAA